MKKITKRKKICGHIWMFDAVVGFGSPDARSYYRSIYHCIRCMRQDIQTIYR